MASSSPSPDPAAPSSPSSTAAPTHSPATGDTEGAAGAPTRPVRRRIIFLDIDGVVSPFGERPFAPACMAELKRVVTEAAADIVLSSTWRTSPYTLQAVNEHLAAVGLAPCLDCTPQLTGFGAGDTRVMEILDWLRHAGSSVAAWVAIDDMNLAWKHEQTMRGHFVHTRSHEGLTRAKADEALALLASAPL